MIDDEAEILTILQGEDVSDDEAEALTSFVEETFEEVEVELHKGDQPLYSYILQLNNKKALLSRALFLCFKLNTNYFIFTCCNRSAY